ncbi:MAG: sigma-54-dependent Fis family transcriptional regulator [Myxococcales bacterium]|nr:sigma-54-dependent Fis family transcriptional regulator [Myxococcales bacterium]MCB9577515.1 sigma-54-dependent Fis family transcriptional regulator [Polyangiaceae bacterium]
MSEDEVEAITTDGADPLCVLVVDDEPTLRRNLARILLSRGMKVHTAGDGAVAMELLGSERVDVALVDLMMPNVGGMELLEFVKSRHADVEVIMMTAFADVETAVKTVRAGAYHFLTKPFRSNDEVVLSVVKAAERRRLLDRARMLEQRLEQMRKFGELIGNSPRMQEVYRLALGVAPTETTVLILGESGTGKELTARAIHQHSRRSGKPFVAVNCSAIPVDLVESELFGHVRGAFSGATATRPGLFEAADGGTIFLDEVGDLPALAQVKLLRVLQQGEIKRVGANETKIVDVRVVAATNVDLRTQIEQGRFRDDLYYRLNVVAIELPALRERKDDIPLLAYHFLHKHTLRAKRDIKRIDPDAMAQLERYPWPGNVRELENAVEHAVVFCHGEALSAGDLPFSRGAPSAAGSVDETSGFTSALFDLPFREAKQRALDEFEESYLSTVLRRAQGNVSEAARQAGLDRSNFRRTAKRAGLLGNKD